MSKVREANVRYRAGNRERWAAFTDVEIRDLTPQKVCGGCKRELPSARFRIDRNRKDGMHGHCTVCRSLGAAKGRAKRDSLPFTLVYEDVGDPEGTPCPACGQDMGFTVGGTGKVGGNQVAGDSPSLDQILPGEGYTPANTVWICTDCNTRKRDVTPATLGTMYSLLDWLYRQYLEREIPCPTRLRPLSYQRAAGRLPCVRQDRRRRRPPPACSPHSNAEEEPQ